jgi:hypothetical protein
MTELGQSLPSVPPDRRLLLALLDLHWYTHDPIRFDLLYGGSPPVPETLDDCLATVREASAMLQKLRREERGMALLAGVLAAIAVFSISAAIGWAQDITGWDWALYLTLFPLLLALFGGLVLLSAVTYVEERTWKWTRRARRDHAYVWETRREYLEQLGAARLLESPGTRAGHENDP